MNISLVAVCSEFIGATVTSRTDENYYCSHNGDNDEEWSKPVTVKLDNWSDALEFIEEFNSSEANEIVGSKADYKAFLKWSDNVALVDIHPDIREKYYANNTFKKGWKRKPTIFELTKGYELGKPGSAIGLPGIAFPSASGFHGIVLTPELLVKVEKQLKTKNASAIKTISKVFEDITFELVLRA